MEGLFGLVKEAMKIVTAADDAYKLIRSWGYEFTRREVREAWREVGLKEAWKTVHETWVERYGYDRKPPAYWSAPGPRGMKTEFQMLVEYQYIDREGRLKSEYVSYATNNITTWKSAIEGVEEYISEYVEREGGRFVGAYIGGIVRRGE